MDGRRLKAAGPVAVAAAQRRPDQGPGWGNNRITLQLSALNGEGNCAIINRRYCREILREDDAAAFV